MNAIKLVAGSSQSGRPLIPVFPDWGLAHASLEDLPILEAFNSYAEVASAHDYWWPLVRGTQALEDFVVLEDTRGVTAARLAQTSRSVIAVFDDEDAAQMLREVQRFRPNLQIVVHARPWEWFESRPVADVVVWQRPSRHLAGMQSQERRAAVRKLRTVMRADGAMLADDNLLEPWWARLLSQKDEVAGNFQALGLRRLRNLIKGGDAFVGIRPLRRWNWPPAEITHRESRRSFSAVLEGRFRHRFGLRPLRRYVVPRKALVVNARRQGLLAHVLNIDVVKRELGPGTAEVRNLFAGTGEVTIALIGLRGDNKARVALRFGYRDIAVARLERGRTALEHLAKGPLARLVPKLLCADTSSAGGAFTAESFLSGVAISELPGGAERDVAFEGAASLLEQLETSQGTRTTIDHATYMRLVGDAIERIRSLTAPDQCAALDRVSALMRAAFIGEVWPLHPVHGDFKAGNILVTPAGEITGIIDWDMWEERGLPLLDLLVLFAYDWSKESGFSFGPQVLPTLLSGTWLPLYERILAKHAESLGLTAHQVRVLRAAFWLRNLQDRLSAVPFVNRLAAQIWIDQPLRQMETALTT